MIPELPRTRVTGTFTPLTIMMIMDNTRANKEAAILRTNGLPFVAKQEEPNRVGNDYTI